MKVAQLLVTAVFAFLGGVSVQWLNADATAQDKAEPMTIRATKIEVVDDKGNVAAAWTTKGLAIFDDPAEPKDAKKSVRTVYSGDGVICYSGDYNLAFNAKILLIKKGDQKAVLDGTGLSIKEGAHELILDDRGLELFKHKKHRLSVGFTDSGKPMVATFDEDGETVTGVIGGK